MDAEGLASLADVVRDHGQTGGVVKADGRAEDGQRRRKGPCARRERRGCTRKSGEDKINEQLGLQKAIYIR